MSRRADASRRRVVRRTIACLLEGSAESRLRAVEDGAIDVALIRGPLAPNASLRAETVHAEPFLGVVPAGHRLSRWRSVPLRALAAEPFLVPASVQNLRRAGVAFTSLTGVRGARAEVAAVYRPERGSRARDDFLEVLRGMQA